MTASSSPAAARNPTPAAGDDLLQLIDLAIEFRHPKYGVNQAVSGVSLTLGANETLGLVGESGCGKSVTVMSILGLSARNGARVTAGEIWFDGVNILDLSERELRRLRGPQIGVVFQDPMTSLNPVLTVRRQLVEPLTRHLGLSRRAADKRAIELLEMVRIPNAAVRVRGYPHELSGGMRQRVMIAMALACEPRLLIADEPTTALDATVQAQIVELIADLSRERGMAVIVVSHDLGVVAALADRVTVMYAGTVVETGLAPDVLNNPQHPYTLGLVRSYPRVEVARSRRLTAISGAPPDPFAAAEGCSFGPRCAYMAAQCGTKPLLREVRGSGSQPPQQVACWFDIDGLDPIPVAEPNQSGEPSP